MDPSHTVFTGPASRSSIELVETRAFHCTTPANVENVALIAPYGRHVTGNIVNSILTSNDYASRLQGSADNDILIAGASARPVERTRKAVLRVGIFACLAPRLRLALCKRSRARELFRSRSTCPHRPRLRCCPGIAVLSVWGSRRRTVRKHRNRARGDDLFHPQGGSEAVCRDRAPIARFVGRYALGGAHARREHCAPPRAWRGRGLPCQELRRYWLAPGAHSTSRAPLALQ
jgi:hypothetical protein